jgi:hypothetical protein
VRDFRGLLDHLATLTRNDVKYGPNGPVVPTLAEPTGTQRHAFQLINTAIPLTLAWPESTTKTPNPRQRGGSAISTAVTSV